MMGVLLRPLLLALVPAATAPANRTKYYLSAYGTNLTAQEGWLTLAQASGDAFQEGRTVDAFWAQGIPSLIQMPVAGVLTGRWGCPGYHGQKGLGTDLNHTAFNMINCFIGAGILTAPAPEYGCGSFSGGRQLVYLKSVRCEYVPMRN